MPRTTSSISLGMGAMMSAVLQAPLGSLMAVLELTHNANIILPSMLVIVTANQPDDKSAVQAAFGLPQPDGTARPDLRGQPLILGAGSHLDHERDDNPFPDLVRDRGALPTRAELDRNTLADYVLVQDRENRSFALEPTAVRAYLEEHP